MDIRFDFSTRVFYVGEKQHSLNDLEDFILKYWYPLAIAHRLKPIIRNGQTLYTYDWSRVFAVAADGGIIIEEFLDKNGLLRTNTKIKHIKQMGLFD